MITCFKCKQKGHYLNKCTEKRTPGLQWVRTTEGYRKYKKKTPQGVANVEAMVFNYYL
jgi:hypothetical protein